MMCCFDILNYKKALSMVVSYFLLLGFCLLSNMRLIVPNSLTFWNDDVNAIAYDLIPGNNYKTVIP